MKRKIYFMGAERDIPRSLMQDVGVRRCGVLFSRIKKRKDEELSDLVEDLKLFESVMIELDIPKNVKDLEKYLQGCEEFLTAVDDAGVNLMVRLMEFPKFREVNALLYDRLVNNGLNVPYPVDEDMGLPEEDFISVTFPRKLGKTGTHAFLLKVLGSGKRVHISRLTNMRAYTYFTPYSSDTAAWLNGVRYGMTYLYRGGMIKSFHKNNALKIRKSLYWLCEKYGIDFDALVEGTTNEVLTEEQIYAVNKVNLIAWHEFAEGV